MGSGRRWHGWHPVLLIATGIGLGVSFGLMALHYVGGVRLWPSAAVFWGACLAWTLQEYMNLRVAPSGPVNRGAGLRFGRALLVTLAWFVGVATWFVTGS